MMIKIVYGYV